MKWMHRLWAPFLKQKPSERQAAEVVSLIKVLAEDRHPKEALKFVFECDNQLYKLSSRIAKAYENGTHPKHRLTAYHDFFVKNVQSGERVLDLGSGTGALAYAIVSRVKDTEVLGLEVNARRVEEANRRFVHPNLRMIPADVLTHCPEGHFDAVMLSNILEHVEDRTEFLSRWVNRARPKRFLIRVPQFNRDWRVALKSEIGVDSRLHAGHFIEYTKDGFVREMTQSGLGIVSMEFAWGEIWSVAAPL